MHKEFLQSEQKPMDAAIFVDRAREMAAALEDREIGVAKSRPVARQRAARIAGVTSSLLHSLRYRPPKTIAADVYARLCVAVEAQAQRHIRNLEHEISARRLGARHRDTRESEAALEVAAALLKRRADADR